MYYFWNKNSRYAGHWYNPPMFFSPYIALGLGVILLMIAILYEVLFIVAKHKGGFGPVKQGGVRNWAWSVPPVAIATTLSAAITSLHFTSQRMEPLADLAAGNSPPNKSLHLDYLSMPLPLAFWNAIINRHRTVACTALMAIVALSLSALSSTILVVKTARIPKSFPLMTAYEFGISDSVWDITDYSASAAITFAFFEGVSPLPVFTTRFFALPAFVNPHHNASELIPITFQYQAIRSMANCERATIKTTTRLNDTATKFVASGGGLPDGCTYNFIATPQLTYNTHPVTCSSFPNASYAPVALWLGIEFPAGSTNATIHPINSTVAPINATVVICSPTIGIATVNVTLNPNASIDEDNIHPYGQDLIFQPTGGMAYNGISYPLDQLDVRAKKRLQNVHFQFTDAIYTAIIKDTPETQAGGPDIQQTLAVTMNEIYQVYLTIFASRAYFVPINNGSAVIVTAALPLPYVIVSTPSVHILAVLLVSLATSSLLVAYQLRNRHKHNDLAQKLAAITGSPFTLAGAMSMSTVELWANEAAVPSRGTVVDTHGGDQEKSVMQCLAQGTYTLDWSGKVVHQS